MSNRLTLRWIIVAVLAVGPALAAVSAACAEEPKAEWKAGVASVVVTPEEPMWMAGYAARDKPSEGKVHDLFAKAIALEDAQGTRLVIVTLDLIGVPRPLRDWMEAEVAKQFQLPPEGLLLNASHTHSGPELRISKASLYELPPERVEQAGAYIEVLKKKLVGIVGEAIQNLAPASLGYSHARAGFAMNRRLPTDDGFRNRPNPDGRVDHDVPVLRVDRPDGELAAVVFGYACHSTTLGFYEFCGDYPGFAQRFIEEAHPGAAALFVTGCGGDEDNKPAGPDSVATDTGESATAPGPGTLPLESAVAPTPGFVSLFDGRSLNGWQGPSQYYFVEDGMLVSDFGDRMHRSHDGGGLLTNKEYDDFILQFEFRVQPGGNSGVLIRTPVDGPPATKGMEIQIIDDYAPRFAEVFDRFPMQRTGSIALVAAAEPGLRANGRPSGSSSELERLRGVLPMAQWGRRKDLRAADRGAMGICVSLG